jgi:hypothetical protein
MICGDMFVPKYNIGKFFEFVYTYEFDRDQDPLEFLGYSII